MANKMCMCVTTEMFNDICVRCNKLNLNFDQYVSYCVSRCSQFMNPNPYCENENKHRYPGRKSRQMSINLNSKLFEVVAHLSDISGVPRANILRDMIVSEMDAAERSEGWLPEILSDISEMAKMDSIMGFRAIRKMRDSIRKKIDIAEKSGLGERYVKSLSDIYWKTCEFVGVKPLSTHYQLHNIGKEETA